MTQIIGVQRRMAELGRIRIGSKTPSGAPKKLDTFRLTSASQMLLEAAASEYGGDVKEWTGAPDEGYFELVTTSDTLDAILPPVFSDRDGSPTLPYSQAFEHWGKGGCLRRCDGETEVLKNQPCSCDPESRECKITTRLNVMLPKVPGFGVWRYESHGWHAATVLPGTLDVLMLAASEQRFIPAVLRLEQKSAKREGQTHRFSVVVIDLPELRVADLLDSSGRPLAINGPAPMPPRPALPAGPEPPQETEFADGAAFGTAPPLPGSEGDVGASDDTGRVDDPLSDEIAELRAALIAKSVECGAHEDKIVAHLLGHESTKTPSEFKAYLKRSIKTVEKNLEEQNKPESDFARKAREAQERMAAT